MDNSDNNDDNDNSTNNNEAYDMLIPIEMMQFKVQGQYGEGAGLWQLSMYTCRDPHTTRGRSEYKNNK